VLPQLLLGPFLVQPLRDPLALGRRQPLRLRRPIVQIAQDDEPEHDRRQPFEQEEPPPALETADAVHPQEGTRYRPANDTGNRRRSHEQGHGARALDGGKPVRQVKDHPWKESRFRQAEQEPQEVETSRARDEHHRGGDDAPGDHDSRDPESGAHALKNEVARHLEEEIAEEEDARSEAEHRGAEVERLVHLQRREPDVDPVQVGHDVEHEHERDQPAADLRQRRAFHGLVDEHPRATGPVSPTRAARVPSSACR
jgi:hypothetical protein